MKQILLVLVVLCGVALATQILHPIARGNGNPNRWKISRDAQPEERIDFKIHLRQHNLDRLEKIFWEVSDPTHRNYGNFLSLDEVKTLIGPKPDCVRRVIEWLVSANITKNFAVVYDYISVSTTVDKASQLFTTSFSLFESVKNSQKTKIRISGHAYIPSEIKDDIDFITGISELVDHSEMKVRSYRSGVEIEDPVITPPILKSYYKIPSTAVGTNAHNFQGIAAFKNYFSFGALQAFDKYFNITPPHVTRVGESCFPNCDQLESNLDVQYITAIAEGIPTLFHFDNSGWILDWAQAISTMEKPPIVNSISYAFLEDYQCLVFSCPNGYDSHQYIARTNIELQVLGVRGISVFTSSGDDGAVNFVDTVGNYPLDPNKFCPLGGCNHTSTQCSAVTFTTPNNTVCYYPSGTGSQECLYFLTSPGWLDIYTQYAEANAACNVAYEQDISGFDHIYSSCPCSQLQSVSLNGYTATPYTFDPANGPVFYLDYPASSPYITSVGATQFLWSGDRVSSEIVCSVGTGAIITSGGGFSTFQPQPSYQAEAVRAWLHANDSIPPLGFFNSSMRAVPDVSFNGHKYLIFTSNNSDNFDKCPCDTYVGDGTSCSSPAFAALVSLINDKLLNAGKSPLGFLNPLLYKMAAAHPRAFTDITAGSNNCNRYYCGVYGYEATAGWDPASGLGTPVFDEFEEYALHVKGLRH